MLNVLVNIYGHVEALPSFYWTFYPKLGCHDIKKVFQILPPKKTTQTNTYLCMDGFNLWFSFAPELVSYWAPRDLHRRAPYSFCESSFLIHHGIYHDYLFVHDDSLTS